MGEILPLVTEERARLVAARRASTCPELFDALDAVRDPELPVLSVYDLGILQDVRREGDTVRVVITPTYSGCPAMEQISDDVVSCLADLGELEVVVELQLAPAWTTDWMDAKARAALRDYGVAPPGSLQCPQCGSDSVEVISEFGSTACKALYRCTSCAEPFDYFKPI